jgi:hypothetical protein
MRYWKVVAATAALVVIVLAGLIEHNKFGAVLWTTWFAVVCIAFTFVRVLARRI